MIPSPPATEKRVRIGVVLFIAIAGVIAALGSWLLRDIDQWWSTMLANIAVVVILLVPGEFVLSRMRSDVGRIEEKANTAQAEASSAKEAAESAERSLDDVRATLMERQRAELDGELAAYKNMVADPSRESLITALRHATEEGLIVADGVRSPVWQTDLHFRFVLNASKTELEVRLEKDDSSVLAVCPWAEGVSAVDFYQSLVQAVRTAGRDLGTLLNDPTESVSELSSMLVEVTRLRAQELAGHRQTHRQIIERKFGWYFTTDWLVGGPHNDYQIEVARLNELDWEEHLMNKGWHGGVSAVQFARSLYGVPAPETSPTGER
ncbi:hypothetical protein ACFVRT_15845 [Arthrobacter koreensis]|uniref:hypothetical protein n=1 Tax=Arthrobacter koreensis TaxID=199136 RepID=UPI0036D8A236